MILLLRKEIEIRSQPKATDLLIKFSVEQNSKFEDNKKIPVLHQLCQYTC